MTEEKIKKLAAQEQMKINSIYLKGDIVAELADSSTATVSDYTYEMLKFHGSYFGYDRDSATKRKKAGLDKEYEFMVRCRIPAGGLTAQQYLKMDELVGKYANNTLRITTRQTFQFHCILKENMKDSIADINHALLSTLSACGDVVRNVTASNAPTKSAKHRRIQEDVVKIVEFCEPKTTAYKEIWVDAPNEGREKGNDIESLYGDTYLPRKFKIGVIIPEDNGIDVFTHDLGFVLIYEGDELKGYNVLLGGGLGAKHMQTKTYPRLADSIAFIKPDELIKMTEAVVKLQRDYGDRTNRQHARLKYLIEEKGVEWTKKTLAEYFGEPLQEVAPVRKYEIPDLMGWHKQEDGKWWLGIPISSGRIEDNDDAKIKTGLKDVISEYGMNLVLTADQNIILCDIEEGQKKKIADKLKSYSIKLREELTELSRYIIACVALPTCGKALAEAERVKTPMEDDIQQIINKHGLENERISVRIAGCPNGCSRPNVGDIGIVGRMPGHYVIYIGGDFEGTRLNIKAFDKVPQADIAKALDPMFALYAAEKTDGEGFGDFCHRYGVDNIVAKAKENLDGFKWAA